MNNNTINWGNVYNNSWVGNNSNTINWGNNNGLSDNALEASL